MVNALLAILLTDKPLLIAFIDFKVYETKKLLKATIYSFPPI